MEILRPSNVLRTAICQNIPVWLLNNNKFPLEVEDPLQILLRVMEGLCFGRTQIHVQVRMHWQLLLEYNRHSFLPVLILMDLAHQSELHQRSPVSLVDERCVGYGYKMSPWLVVSSHN